MKRKVVLNKIWKGLKWVSWIALAYIGYVIVTAVLPFIILSPKEANTRFVPETVEETDERVALAEFGPDAWNARINLLESAQETLDISYFYMSQGSSVYLFYAHILEAANRGVEVRYLMDGIFHGMRGEDRSIINVFNEHPNIELRFYEPLDLLRPWTWNNRMHDKLLIMDGKYAMTGGRNIGDRYYARLSYEKEFSYDRDVLILNPDSSSEEESIVNQMSAYYDQLWASDYSISQTNRELNQREKENAEAYKKEVEEWLTASREQTESTDRDYTIEDWWERSHEVDSGYFIHNSIERGQKEPFIWQDMLRLVKDAEEQVLIQSPWMIPDRHMRKDIDIVEDHFSFEEGILLTNARSSNHNPGAQSATENHRNSFVESEFDLFEYQPPESSLHMKTLVVDRKISAVGAYNFDARSSYLSTENMLVVNSEGLAEEILESVEEKYMVRSARIDEEGNEIEDGEVEIRAVPFWKNIWVLFLGLFSWIFESLL